MKRRCVICGRFVNHQKADEHKLELGVDVCGYTHGLKFIEKQDEMLIKKGLVVSNMEKK